MLAIGSGKLTLTKPPPDPDDGGPGNPTGRGPEPTLAGGPWGPSAISWLGSCGRPCPSIRPTSTWGPVELWGSLGSAPPEVWPPESPSTWPACTIEPTRTPGPS